jgi:hypothetical protein
VKHFNGSLQVQAQQAVRGGTDLNCGALYGEQNAAAVRGGARPRVAESACGPMAHGDGSGRSRRPSLSAAAGPPPQVTNGLLREAELDVALQRIYTKAFQLGVVDQEPEIHRVDPELGSTLKLL